MTQQRVQLREQNRQSLHYALLDEIEMDNKLNEKIYKQRWNIAKELVNGKL